MSTTEVLTYTPGRHYAWQTEAHDMARARRTLADGTEQSRMECKCGKRSRWTETFTPLHAAANRHADETARR
jgi:hypothetical protein